MDGPLVYLLAIGAMAVSYTHLDVYKRQYLLLAGTILSMCLVYGWTTIQELLLTFSLAFFAAANLMPVSYTHLAID